MGNKRRKIVQIAGLIIAGIFIGYGKYRGEIGIVLNKAVNICFECIGLG
ncbi:MAG: thioredoxin [Lachnospiraceae bacterium]|nr:thioredoxin [Lachnospiraceae bacterium]